MANRDRIGGGRVVVEITDDLERARALRGKGGDRLPDGARAHYEHADGHAGQGPWSQPGRTPKEHAGGHRETELDKGHTPETEIRKSITARGHEGSRKCLTDEQARHQFAPP